MRIPSLPAIFLCAAMALTAQMNLRRAPGFCLPDGVNPTQFHDLADYRGKFVILEFMKTNCPHCATFTGILEQVQQKFGDKIAILAAVNTTDDNPNTVRQYIAGHKITYPIMLDMGQMQYSYLRTPTADVPHVYIIDPNGYIRSDYGYSLTTRDIFEGHALLNEIDRWVGGASKK
jgi:thiol-disulfide isomerase/thioredoxin